MSGDPLPPDRLAYRRARGWHMPRWSHHRRFYAALAVAALVAGPVGALLGGGMLRLVAAADAFFVTYIAAVAVFAMNLDRAHLRRHVAQADEGLWLIAVTVVGVFAASVLASFQIMSAPHAGVWRGVLAFLSVPLGWATLHMAMCFHYATLWYAPDAQGAPQGGLIFPQTSEPGLWEFLYHSYVIGMAAQVADVSVSSTRMRQVVLIHSIIGFFYNTIILALAVNAAASFV